MIRFRHYAAPLASASKLLACWRDRAFVAWSSPASPTSPLTVVGLGAVRSVRTRGAARWRDALATVRAINDEFATPDLPAIARPRWLGGAAFVPGAADREPWSGFGDAWFMLPRWSYVADGHHAHLVLAIDSDDGDLDDARWQAEHARIVSALTAAHSVAHPGLAQPALRASEPTDVAGWQRRVDDIIAAIADGSLAKVVAARAHAVTFAEWARIADLAAALDARYPDSVRLAVQPPAAGCLVAASPERLVRRAGTVIECDALAGTVRAGRHAELPASGKDRREQALVVAAIRDALIECGLTVEAGSEPVVRTHGPVAHLHTPIRATADRPPHILELVARLHPTPAVGGTPTADAVAWIAAREARPRGWYASPVGWFDVAGDGEFAVAIRSGVVVGNRVHLYAGAGIVAGSSSELELAETELKLSALRDALAHRSDVL